MKNNIYLFYGNEDFLIDEEVKSIKSSDTEEFDGASADEVIQSIVTTPMFGGQKTVIIKNPDFEDDKQLINALINKPDDTMVIFIIYGDFDRRKKFFKELVKIAESKEFKTIADWQQDKTIGFITERAKVLGKKISTEDAMFLSEICGNNLRVLMSELEKLSVFAGNKTTIDKSDIEEIASAGSVAAFSLLAHLRNRNLQKSLIVLDKLIKDKEEPVRLLQLIATQYRLMLKIKDIGSNDLSRLGASIYFVKKVKDCVKKFTMDELKKTIRLLSDADYKIKHTSQPPRMVLEMLLGDIC